MKLKMKGMTLLEVLVALAIFATAAISVIRATTQHINAVAYLEEKTFASLVVDNIVAKVMLDGAPNAERMGKSELAGQDWYWKVKPVKVAVGYFGAFDVSVSTDKEQKSPIVTVRSYVEKK